MNSNIILNIKHIFLNFAQQYFANYAPLKWTYNPKTTQIVIADKTAVDIGIAAHRPSIIFSRGEMAWMYVTRGQDAKNAIFYNKKKITSVAGVEPNAGWFNHTVYSDLLRCSANFNIISKSGPQAEQIANQLFCALTGYQADLKKLGILKFNAMQIGQETTMRATSEVELVSVPIDFAFMTQQTIIKDEKFYNCLVYINEYINELTETFEFEVINDGTQIKILQYTIDNNVDKLFITYRDAITLEIKRDIELIPSSVENVYTIPDNGVVLNYYHMVKDINSTINGTSLWIDDVEYFQTFDFDFFAGNNMLEIYNSKIGNLDGKELYGYSSGYHILENQIHIKLTKAEIYNNLYLVEYL